MSKNWYPVVDFEKCVQCGTCVDMCRHGVYDKARAPEPVVVFPEGCVQGCKGCGNRCPVEAIQYVGDVGAANGGGCGCGCAGA
jgi:NAD-dependent dihydropyrimidine dehydrogenase PreA subunit